MTVSKSNFCIGIIMVDFTTRGSFEKYEEKMYVAGDLRKASMSKLRCSNESSIYESNQSLNTVSLF